MKIVNRRAKYDYEVMEDWEAGIMLIGAEVKSVKKGNASLAGSRVVVKAGENGKMEAFVVGMQVNAYENASDENYDPIRTRKLLLRREEIEKIMGKIAQKGLTVVPLECYNRNRLIKLKIGLVRGKKEFEKRETLKKRDIQRKLETRMKG